MPVREMIDRKKKYGQFFTPLFVAEYMASLLDVSLPVISLLDPGAGKGVLSAAYVRRLIYKEPRPRQINVTAYELDLDLIPELAKCYQGLERECRANEVEFHSRIVRDDFVHATVLALSSDLFEKEETWYNAAIVNPPYSKIGSDSRYRKELRKVGIETGNLYTAFLALITRLLPSEGQVVAITPRSFCNGPYFKLFRKDFLESMSLRRIHVFDSRSAAFRSDDVLQENVIIHAVKEKEKRPTVLVSSSTGEPGSPVVVREVEHSNVVSDDDPDQFIHLVLNDAHLKARSRISKLKSTLTELGIEVSTGRVVDFRATRHLRRTQRNNTVPLIYPVHFNSGHISWPNLTGRKPNAIVANKFTESLLVPKGNYVLVKRFTSKEERRRLVACVLRSRDFAAHLIGIENHLNFFHISGKGMPYDVAAGLAALLNSTVVDQFFRQFSGHTQVNATDLRKLPYPSFDALRRLGEVVVDPGIAQNELDMIIEKELEL